MRTDDEIKGDMLQSARRLLTLYFYTDSLKYKSGRYKTYGLNVQAVSDARRRCIYLDISFGGAANDRKAAANIMHELNTTLPDGY